MKNLKFKKHTWMLYHDFSFCYLKIHFSMILPYTCMFCSLSLFSRSSHQSAVANFLVSGFGGLEVGCWPMVPKFAGSHPAEAVGFLGRK